LQASWLALLAATSSIGKRMMRRGSVAGFSPIDFVRRREAGGRVYKRAWRLSGGWSWRGGRGGHKRLIRMEEELERVHHRPRPVGVETCRGRARKRLARRSRRGNGVEVDVVGPHGRGPCGRSPPDPPDQVAGFLPAWPIHPRGSIYLFVLSSTWWVSATRPFRQRFALLSTWIFSHLSEK
jgi:hypothetical protein